MTYIICIKFMPNNSSPNVLHGISYRRIEAILKKKNRYNPPFPVRCLAVCSSICLFLLNCLPSQPISISASLSVRLIFVGPRLPAVSLSVLKLKSSIFKKFAILFFFNSVCIELRFMKYVL